ncbi:TPA: NADP oxidoreductase [bacterium]|nr:NADP oxidoreductase [bacterium]
MPKIRPEDLDRISEEMRRTILLRQGAGRVRVIVHMDTCGIAAGGRSIMKALMEEIEERQIKDVLLITSGCAGLCNREPMVTVELEDEPPVKYVDLTPEKIKRIFKEHVINGQVVIEYTLAIEAKG